MTGSREFIRGNLTLEAISLTQQKLNIKIEDELAKKGVLLRLFRNANLFLSVISKITNKSTEFEAMDSWSADDEEGGVDVIYKNWEIPIVSTSEAGLDSLATLIIPYITYKILYETGSENDIDFYAGQYNLKQTSHFEVKNETLYLKVSVYMEKYFDSPDLIVPNAKILVDFKNPFQVSH